MISKKQVIQWLETKDPNESYETEPHDCPMVHCARNYGFAVDAAGFNSAYKWANEIGEEDVRVSFEDNIFFSVFHPEPHTYGAALKRAKG